MVNRALEGLSGEFETMYSHMGRPSIAPEQLLRALLVQVLYSIRSERLLVERLDPARGCLTLGADKGYDTRDSGEGLRRANVSPHLVRTTPIGVPPSTAAPPVARPGYAHSQRVPKRIEEAFGWAKTIGGLCRLRHRGLPKVDLQFPLTFAAYNLVRLRTPGGGT